MTAIVYLATNRTNGKRYVGMTGRSLERRRAHHERDSRVGQDSSPRFHAAIRSNLSKANSGKKQSAEVVAKRVAHRLGRPLTDEHRNKIRKALTGRKRPPEVIARIKATRARCMEAANG